jgi:hypothetical protein
MPRHYFPPSEITVTTLCTAFLDAVIEVMEQQAAAQAQ